MQDLPNGELHVSSESSTPAYVDGWSPERKIREFRKWVEENYAPENAMYYDFSEWENEDELTESWELSSVSTEKLLRQVWGNHITAQEFEGMLKTLDQDFPDDWIPDDLRISVEEMDEDEDEEITYEYIKKSVPRIRSNLKMLEDALPVGIGHNQPPNEAEINVRDFEDIRQLLDYVEDSEVEELENSPDKLAKLALLSISVTKSVTKYVADVGDVFVKEFAKTAGQQTAKWTARGLSIWIALEGLKNFAEAISKLLN